MFRLTGHIFLMLLSISVFAQLKQKKIYYNSENRAIKEIYYFNKKDSSLEGTYELFYVNGSLNIFGYYKNNLADSIWTYYFQNGKKKAEGRFKKGIQQGIWKYFYENGNLKSQGTLNKGIKDGYWSFYYETGGEKSSGIFKNDVKNGIWNYFYEDGSLKGQSYLEEGSGKYTEFYPSGAKRMEGNNINEKSNGNWKYYYETGELEAQGDFKLGLRDGKWIYYYKNGNKAAVGNYVNGVRQGEWIYYHENGNISETGEINEGVKDGYWKLFYPTGELLGEATFKKGTGSFDEYYPSGSKKSNGEIVNGKKNGKWYYYSDNGAIEGEADLVNGEGRYIGYYPNGQIKMTGKIKDDKRVGEWTLYNDDGTLAGTYFPIYENEKPVFITRESSDESVIDRIDKPEYKYKKKEIRYFQPRINEYRGLIIASNPLWLLDNRIPLSFEYYIQERLGYEIQLDIIRDPFFTSDENIAVYYKYERGIEMQFRQKFYSRDTESGMLYFGHELLFRRIDHQVNHIDTMDLSRPNRYGNMIETGYGYGVIIGNRWMRNAGDAGPTFDIFIGIGVKSRNFKKKYEPDQVFDNYFNREIKKGLDFPLIFGINIGLAGPGNKSKTQ